MTEEDIEEADEAAAALMQGSERDRALWIVWYRITQSTLLLFDIQRMLKAAPAKRYHVVVPLGAATKR